MSLYVLFRTASFCLIHVFPCLLSHTCLPLCLHSWRIHFLQNKPKDQLSHTNIIMLVIQKPWLRFWNLKKWKIKIKKWHLICYKLSIFHFRCSYKLRNDTNNVYITSLIIWFAPLDGVKNSVNRRLILNY